MCFEFGMGLHLCKLLVPCSPFNLVHWQIHTKTGLFVTILVFDRIMCSNSVIIHGRCCFYTAEAEVLWKRVMLTRLCDCNILILRNRLSRNILLKNRVSEVFVSVILVWLFPSFGHAQLLRNLQRNGFHKSPNLSFFQ